MKYFIAALGLITFNTYASPIISTGDQANIADYLDGICMDTYCGGDINWVNPSLECDATKCDLNIGAQSWYDDEVWTTVEDFEKLPESTVTSENAKLISAEMTEAGYDEDTFETIRIDGRCELNLPSNIGELSYGEKEDAVYDATLDCVDALQSLIYKL